MSIYLEQINLPYAPQRVFDLVADIESYPRFLPNVVAARITRRDGNTLWVDQLVRVKMLRLRFSTRAVLNPPLKISVTCSDSLIGVFHEEWDFAEGPSGGTHLQCRAEYEIRSGLLKRTMSAVMRDLLKSTVQAFQVRAGQLYGASPLV